MPGVKFKYPDEKSVFPKLVSAINAICIAMKKNCTCTSGYRRLEKQKTINAQKLAESKDNYQKPNGAVYDNDGKCIAAAYGQSNHCYCIAMDISDEWFKALTNKEIEKFGLVKPMSYEPWHVQLKEHTGLSLSEKIAIKESVLGIKRS